MDTYELKLCGVKRELPFIDLEDNLAFASFVIMGDTELITACAPELAEKFEVSVRTIYRDIDRISGAGVPVYSVAGRTGGIRMLDRFVLEKSLLSEEEMRDILFGLQSLAAVQNSDMETVLSKLRAAFQMADTSWIEVDVSRWGSDPARERLDFNVLKQAVMARRQIHCKYYGSNGMDSGRDCHPSRLIHKAKEW